MSMKVVGLPPLVGYSRTQHATGVSKLSDSDFTDADPWADLDADSFTPAPPPTPVPPPVVEPVAPTVEEPAAAPAIEDDGVPHLEDVVAPPLDADLDALTSGLGDDIEEISQVDESTSDVADEGLDIGDFDLEGLDLDALAPEAPLDEAPQPETADPELDDISAALAEVGGLEAEDLEVVADVPETAISDLEPTDDMDTILAELEDVPDPGGAVDAEDPVSEAPSPSAPRMSPFLASSGLFGTSEPLTPQEPESSDSQESQPEMSEEVLADGPEELHDVVQDLELEDVPESSLEFDTSSVPSAYGELNDLSDTPDVDDAIANLEIPDDAIDNEALADVALQADDEIAAVTDEPETPDISFDALAEVSSDTDLVAAGEDGEKPSEPEEPTISIPDDDEPSAIEMHDIDFTNLETEDPTAIESAESGEVDGPIFGAVLGSGGDASPPEDTTDDLDLGVSFGFADEDSVPDQGGEDASEVVDPDAPISLDEIDLSGITGSTIEFTDTPTIDMGIASEVDESSSDASSIDPTALTSDGATIDAELSAAAEAISVEGADAEAVTDDDTSGTLEAPAGLEGIDEDFSALAAMVADVEPTIVGEAQADATAKETDELGWLDDELKSDVLPAGEAPDDVSIEVESLDAETDASSNGDAPVDVTEAAVEAIDDFDISADPFSMAPTEETLHGDGGEIAVETNDTPQIPDIGAVEVEVPDMDMPDLATPDLEIPAIEVPNVEVPDAELPEIEDLAEVEVPDMDIPDLATPDLEIPAIEVPDVEVPDAELPEIEDLAVADIELAIPEGPGSLEDSDPAAGDVPDISSVDMSALSMDTSAVGGPDIDVPDIGAVTTPNIDLPEIDVAEIESPSIAMAGAAAAVAAGTFSDGSNAADTPDESPQSEEPTAEVDTSAGSDDGGIDSDEWGAKWQESLQGWVPDDQGQRVWRPIVTTSQELNDFVIEKYLGVVFGDASVDLSAATEQAISNARQVATAAMVAEAMTRGAHAVIAVAIGVQTVGNQVLVTGTGTAVALIEQPAGEDPA